MPKKCKLSTNAALARSEFYVNSSEQ